MSDIKDFEELMKTMKILRAPHGCEWDAAQTHESLKPYMIEEAFEAVEAIESKDPQKLKEELGDVLLQVIFHALISEEEGEFDIYDVAKSLNEKLIRRHPHVFGDVKGYSYERWEEIKASEKNEKKKELGKINPALPGLSMARRIQENAAAYGFDWQSAEPVLDKIEEEFQELKEAKTQEEKMEEVGDLLFAVVNLARHLNIDPEVAVRKTNEKFINRFEKMYELAEKNGMDFKSQPIEIMEEFWQKAKREE
jgi:tetrapyrrole methylase family protein/MazG family protein